jgi:integrase
LVAQSVERLPVKQMVRSSSLLQGANILLGVSEGLVKTFWGIRHLSRNTQETYARNLRRLAKNADLNDPMSVERYVFGIDVTNKYRNALFDAYAHYSKSNELGWIRPRVRSEKAPIKLPTEENIDKIISSASLKYALIFQLSKHGLRPDEISKIILRDIDTGNGTLSVRTSKMGLERTLKLRRETFDLFREYLSKNMISDLNKKLFAHPRTIGEPWTKYRKLAYKKFRDPELLKIRLYDLRHWYGTTQYIQTRDIFHVKYLMGHRNIESTLHYMHIAKGLVNYSDDYHVKVASSLEEYMELLETGFEYVSDYDDKKILRKRK